MPIDDFVCISLLSHARTKSMDKALGRYISCRWPVKQCLVYAAQGVIAGRRLICYSLSPI